MERLRRWVGRYGVPGAVFAGAFAAAWAVLPPPPLRLFLPPDPESRPELVDVLPGGRTAVFLRRDPTGSKPPLVLVDLDGGNVVAEGLEPNAPHQWLGAVEGGAFGVAFDLKSKMVRAVTLPDARPWFAASSPGFPRNYENTVLTGAGLVTWDDYVPGPGDGSFRYRRLAMNVRGRRVTELDGFPFAAWDQVSFADDGRCALVSRAAPGGGWPTLWFAGGRMGLRLSAKDCVLAALSPDGDTAYVGRPSATTLGAAPRCDVTAVNVPTLVEVGKFSDTVGVLPGPCGRVYLLTVDAAGRRLVLRERNGPPLWSTSTAVVDWRVRMSHDRGGLIRLDARGSSRVREWFNRLFAACGLNDLRRPTELRRQVWVDPLAAAASAGLPAGTAVVVPERGELLFHAHVAGGERPSGAVEVHPLLPRRTVWRPLLAAVVATALAWAARSVWGRWRSARRKDRGLAP